MKDKDELMTQSNRRYQLFGALLATLTLGLDQWSKAWALAAFSGAAVPEPVTPFFNLVLVWNYGMSFGIFAGHREAASLLLGGVAVAVVFVLVFWLVRANGKAVPLALGLVIGGAAGNIVDRARFGAVADFLDFHAFGYHWPAFNLADSAIFLGVAVLCWDNIRCKKDAKNSET